MHIDSNRVEAEGNTTSNGLKKMTELDKRERMQQRKEIATIDQRKIRDIAEKENDSWPKVGSIVFNKKNGYGIIEHIAGIIMQVKYRGEEKRYVYPDAFIEGILREVNEEEISIDIVKTTSETDKKNNTNTKGFPSDNLLIYDQSQPGAESLTKYLLTDENCVRNRVCPKCKYTLWLKRYNIPVYDSIGKFISYYVDKLHWCPTCKVVYMTEETFTRIQNRVLKERKYIRPSNMRTMVKKHPDKYLSDPTLDKGLEVYTRSKTQGYEGQQIYNLASSSFLSDEGYSISVPMAERHEILNTVVQKYGKRRVADHLRFLIRTRQGQKEGRSKFANAISIWNNDLDYVVNL